MPTSYPSNIDNFTNPTATDTLDSVTVPHASQHTNINDAVEAIETALGANLANVVLPARTISTTSPLSGGGDLSGNRTLSIADATTSVKGAVQLTDSVSSTSTTTAATPNAVKTAYDSSLVKGLFLPYQSGFYYRTLLNTIGIVTPTHETTYYTPIFINGSNDYDRIALRAVSGFSGTATVRLGIYADTSGIPSTLVLDAGTVSATAANATYQITINQTLSTGFYWLAFCQQGTAPTTGSYSGNAASTINGNLSIFSGGTGAPTSNLISGYTQSSVTGAFANAGTLTAATSSVYTWIRKS
jgi:hypothetical protein